MLTPDIELRLRRAYAAIEETVETDPAKFKPNVERFQTPDGSGIRVNFRGNYAPAQLENIAAQTVYNVAHFADQLKRWGKAHGHDPGAVDEIRRGSLALKVITDLSNTDKHGPPRDGGFSGLRPRLSDLTRALRLTAGTSSPEASFRLTPSGSVELQGDASAVIDARVIDGKGNFIDDLSNLVRESLRCLESLLERWNLGGPPPTAPTSR